MKRAIAILVVAACSGGGGKKDTKPGGSGTGIYAKKIVVSWGLQAQPRGTEVFLETTDETGKQVSYPLGTYEGTCQVIKPAEDMKAVTGVNCTGGTELHAVVTQEEIIVLKMKVAVGTPPDPMSREEITRIKAPGGAAIEAGT